MDVIVLFMLHVVARSRRMQCQLKLWRAPWRRGKREASQKEMAGGYWLINLVQFSHS